MISQHTIHPLTTADTKERTDQPPEDIRHLDPAQQARLREIDQQIRLQSASLRRQADAAMRALR